MNTHFQYNGAAARNVRRQHNANHFKWDASRCTAAGVHPSHPRIEWLDALRGFIMYFVIYGHITEADDAIIYIYSFHMPMFFIISGITFGFNRETNSMKFVKKKFCGLMIPYFILSLYAAPLREWLERIGENNRQSFSDLIIGTLFSNADSGYKMASNTLWFIPCLFLTVLLVFFTQKISIHFSFFLQSKQSQFLRLPVSDWITTMLVIGLICTAKHLHLDEGSSGIWHYRTAIFATGFYLFGYLLLPHISALQDWIERHRILNTLMIFLLLLTGRTFREQNGFVSMIRNQYHDLAFYYACALTTCMAWILLFMMLTSFRFFRKISGFFDFIGKKTLPYIAFQVPVMKLISYYIPLFGRHVEPYVTIL